MPTRYHRSFGDRVSEYFGTRVSATAPTHPARARNLLITGFKVKRFQTRHLPDKQQSPWGHLASRAALESMVDPLCHPERAVFASMFLPTEMFRAAGLLPYAAEAFSAFSTAAYGEQAFIHEAEARGVAETYCSFHKSLMGALSLGVLERPILIAHCSLACDANNLTFKTMARDFDVPRYAVDVPYEPGPDAVTYVSDQLHELAEVLAGLGHPVDPDRLRELTKRSRRSLEALSASLPARRGHNMHNSMGLEMQAALGLHLWLGEPLVEEMCRQVGRDMQSAERFDGINLVWMHVPPFYQKSLQRMIDHVPDCQIIASDMCFDMAYGLDAYGPPHDPESLSDPYTFLAERLVYNCFNGGSERRIGRILSLAEATQADGVVCFCQWGCKHTAGLSQTAKTYLEDHGYPTLVLESDCCDRANIAGGQVETRLGAFLEMLRARRQEKTMAS